MSIRKSLLVLIFGGALAVLLLREQQRGTLEPFDRVHLQFLKANPASTQRTATLEEPAVVLARLDDVDQANRVFGAWPLGAEDWQVILQNLPGYGPKAATIAVPLPFEKAPPGLEASAKAIPGLNVAAATSTAASDGSQTLPESVPVLKVRGSTAAIPEFKAIRPPAIPGAAAPNDIDLLPRNQKLSVDGDWCRVPMLARLGTKVVPTLALRSLLEWSAVPAQDVSVQLGVEISAGKNLRIPIDDGGFFRYFLSLAPEVPSVNADIFVLTREQAMSNLLPGDPQSKVLDGLKHSLLWFGPDDLGSRLLKRTNGTPVSPAELTARAIAAIQTDSYMRPLDPSMQWIPPAAMLLFCLWLTHWRKSRLWPGAMVAAVALVGVSLYLYRNGHHWMPLGPSLALLFATVLLSYLVPVPGSRPEPQPGAPKSGRHTKSSQPVASVSPPAPAHGSAGGMEQGRRTARTHHSARSRKAKKRKRK